MSHEHRRLAAIVSADVAGYSRLMERDEAGTLTRMRTLRGDLVDPSITQYGGRIVKSMGDGLLLEFPSVVAAVQCAIDVQLAMERRNAELAEIDRLVLRIGINLGDIIADGDDIHGDGVNIAARLEALSEPGGICLSAAAREQVGDRLNVRFVDGGEHRLKNIERPVRLWRWEPIPRAATADAPLVLPDKPSIAVLPFENMSADPEQSYFADGVAEDVLTTLSKIQELFVIARNSSFAFKGQAKDVREIGRILGARYVLEGSVRKAGNRVRLTAQLIDAANGQHKWADRYEGDLDDVFELQDRITQEIASALEVNLAWGEQARVWRKRSGSPLAYEHYLRGGNLYRMFSKHTHAEARRALELALEINPNGLPALVALGLTFADEARFGWRPNPQGLFAAALECARKALAIDPAWGDAYWVIGYVRTYQRRHDEALEAGEKSIALNPNGAGAYHLAGASHGFASAFERAVRYEMQSQRLSPLEYQLSIVDEARARLHLGQFATAKELAARVLQSRPRWLTAQSTLLASHWYLGEREAAREVGQRLLADHPHFSASRWAKSLPYKHAEDLNMVIEPLRAVALPD
jgi:adenylate cyclase